LYVTPVYLEGSVPPAMIMVNDLEKLQYFLIDRNLSSNSKGIILLRMIPTTSHTLSDIDETLALFLNNS
jgi:glycine C-acetyltransferase